MKITKKRLKQIIKEELAAAIKEWGSGPGYGTLDRIERERAAAGKGAFKSHGGAAGAVLADRRRREAEAKAKRGGRPGPLELKWFPELFPEWECCRDQTPGGFVGKKAGGECKSAEDCASGKCRGGKCQACQYEGCD